MPPVRRVSPKHAPGMLMALISLSALLSIVPPAAAQVLYGTLTGNVTDPSGGPVPGAKVDAVNTATGVAQTTTTNQTGQYSFTTLQPGPYKVTIAAAAFSTVTQTGVNVNVNAVTRSDAQLKVAGINQTVTVSGTAELMQTDRGDVHTDIATKQIADLPIAGSEGRNFESLLKLVPGVTPPQEQNSAAGNPERAMSFNSNGISRVTNNVKLDGASVIYPWLPYLVAYVPPQEAIQEVNITTNSFLAEQGEAGGSAVNAVIRSGTNQFHGAAWEYNTNTDFNARPFFFKAGVTVPKNILNQFGARMGGPIKKNKLFFFGDWERTTQRQAISGLATLPTADLNAGNFSGTGTIIYDPRTGNTDGTGRAPFAGNQIPSTLIDPVVAKYVALLPQPNLTGASSNFFGAANYAFTRDNADGKITYQVNDDSQVFGRYSISKGTINDPFQLGAADGGTWDGGQPGAAFFTVQNIAAGGTHTFSPDIVMDGNAGFDRQYLGAAAPDVNTVFGQNGLPFIAGTNTGSMQGGIPFFNVQNGWVNMGNASTGSPFLFRDNAYVTNLNLSWMRHTHQLRFGFEFTHSQLNHFQPQGGVFQTARGSFRFTGGLTSLNGGPGPNQYNSWADFLLGLPQEEGKVVQTINPNALRWSTWAGYAQDQWQVSPKLTLTLGVRYEFYPFLYRDHTGNFTFVPSTGLVLIGCENGVPCDTGIDVGHGFVAPRFGFAYRLDSRTVIRGGAGLSADPDNWRDMRNTYPAFLTTDFSGANSFDAAGALTGLNGITTLPQGALTTGLPAAAVPDITQGKIPLPSKISTETVPNPFRRGYIESYNLSLQRDLGSGFTGTAAFVGTHEVRQMSNVNINAAAPGTGNAGRLLAAINTTDINAAEPFGTVRYDALQTQLTRRMGSAQLGASYTYSRAIDFGDDSTLNGLVFAYPTFWSRDRAATGYDRTHNFQFWTTYELPFGKRRRYFEKGVAAYILGGWQLNAVVSVASGLPFTVQASNTILNAPGNTETAQQVLPNVQILGNVGPGQSWFNTAAYATPAPGTFGNTGRNSQRGPGMFELDGGLFRNFQFREKYQFQFRAEAFSLTNTPIFANPGNTVGSSTFGQITSTAVSANGVSTGGGSRVLRLGLKFSF